MTSTRKLMMFDLSRHVDRSTVPDGRTVIEFHFTDLPGKLRGWWLVIDPGGVDVCDADPGHDITSRFAAAFASWSTSGSAIAAGPS